MIASIAIFLLFCLWASFEGWREAILFHKVELDKVAGRIIHRNFTIQRALVIGMIIATNLDWWVLSLPFVFPFFHDGQYYTTRNKYNKSIYTKKWFSQSTTSTALTTKIFTPVVRSVLAVVGLVGIVLAMTIK